MFWALKRTVSLHVMFSVNYMVCFYMSTYHMTSHDVTSGSDITLCNKIDKPLMVYIFSENVMQSFFNFV